MIYLRLFWEFFKTGLFAVGGGMATLPFLYDISDRTLWFTHAQLADMVAVSESTPGPIGVNMATYVGFLTGGRAGGAAGGVLGAVVATVGLITPSIIVILIVSAFLQRFRDSKYVNGAFYGLRPASTAMILAAGVLVVKAAFLPAGTLSSLDWRLPVLAAALLALTNAVKRTKKLHPIVFILGSAAVGIALRLAE
ncbi:MAG: chromate transporter [Oscillospiraceae bacterium]|nr:chromate transporter [Oscillospiraceae bacterium]